jgi:hypothetical protein
MTVGASGAAPCVLEIIGSGLRPKGGESDNDGDKDGRTQNCPRAHGQRLRETTKARRKRLGMEVSSVGGGKLLEDPLGDTTYCSSCAK